MCHLKNVATTKTGQSTQEPSSKGLYEATAQILKAKNQEINEKTYVQYLRKLNKLRKRINMIATKDYTTRDKIAWIVLHFTTYDDYADTRILYVFLSWLDGEQADEGLVKFLKQGRVDREVWQVVNSLSEENQASIINDTDKNAREEVGLRDVICGLIQQKNEAKELRTRQEIEETRALRKTTLFLSPRLTKLLSHFLTSLKRVTQDLLFKILNKEKK